MAAINLTQFKEIVNKNFKLKSELNEKVRMLMQQFGKHRAAAEKIALHSMWEARRKQGYTFSSRDIHDAYASDVYYWYRNDR